MGIQYTYQLEYSQDRGLCTHTISKPERIDPVGGEVGEQC